MRLFEVRGLQQQAFQGFAPRTGRTIPNLTSFAAAPLARNPRTKLDLAPNGRSECSRTRAAKSTCPQIFLSRCCVCCWRTSPSRLASLESDRHQPKCARTSEEEPTAVSTTTDQPPLPLPLPLLLLPMAAAAAVDDGESAQILFLLLSLLCVEDGARSDGRRLHGRTRRDPTAALEKWSLFTHLQGYLFFQGIAPRSKWMAPLSPP